MITREHVYRLLAALDDVVPLDPLAVCRHLDLPAAVVAHVCNEGWAAVAGRSGSEAGMRRTVKGAQALAAMTEAALIEWGDAPAGLPPQWRVVQCAE